MQGTMQTTPLTTTMLMRHGLTVHRGTRIVTDDGTPGSRTATFAEVGERAERLAAALRRLGVRSGDRVATLAWNHQAHFEAYLAVPAMGAVLHTLNLRLCPEQLAWIINHAEDKVLLVDQSLTPLLAKLGDLPSLEHVIVVEDGYEDLLAAEEPGPDHLAAVIRDERITFAEGVPTLWNDMLVHTEAYGVDFSSLRMILSGGSACLAA